MEGFRKADRDQKKVHTLRSNTQLMARLCSKDHLISFLFDQWFSSWVILSLREYLAISRDIYWRRQWHQVLQYSSTLAWKMPWMEEPGRLQSMGSRRVGHDWVTSLSLSCIRGGNGNPLQCSCLVNPRDGGAWWAAVYGVAQSRTWLKQLSSSSRDIYGLSTTGRWEALLLI